MLNVPYETISFCILLFLWLSGIGASPEKGFIASTTTDTEGCTRGTIVLAGRISVS